MLIHHVQVEVGKASNQCRASKLEGGVGDEPVSVGPTQQWDQGR